MSRPTFVYVIQASDDGPVAVGSSIDPRRRLAEFQRECPLRAHGFVDRRRAVGR